MILQLRQITALDDTKLRQTLHSVLGADSGCKSEWLTEPWIAVIVRALNASLSAQPYEQRVESVVSLLEKRYHPGWSDALRESVVVAIRAWLPECENTKSNYTFYHGTESVTVLAEFRVVTSKKREKKE